MSSLVKKKSLFFYFAKNISVFSSLHHDAQDTSNDLRFSIFFVFFYLPTVGTCTQGMFVARELTICQKVFEPQ